MTGSEDGPPSLMRTDAADWRSAEALYRDHATWLRSRLMHGLRLQSCDAEDIVQETWLRAADRDGLEIAHPKAFLAQTALNLFRDRTRRESVRDRHAVAVAANDAGGRLPAPGLLEQEAAYELKRVILALPEIYRDAFLLSRFGGMTHAAIAIRLGVSIKTVEWRIGRALALCAVQTRE